MNWGSLRAKGRHQKKEEGGDELHDVVSRIQSVKQDLVFSALHAAILGSGVLISRGNRVLFVSATSFTT